MLCVEKIEEVTSLLKLMQLQEKEKRIQPVRKVIHMINDLPAEMNFLYE
jgi:hypothetical protein